MGVRTHCKNGHDLAEVGMNKNNQCLACRREYQRQYEERNPDARREYRARNRERERERKRQRHRATYVPRERKPREPRTHCRHGHDLAVVGVQKSGYCKACQRIANSRRKPDGRPSTVVNPVYRREREEAMLVYGDGSCAHCGGIPSDLCELQLHHVNADGAKHRKAIGGRKMVSIRFVRHLKDNGWPTSPLLVTVCPPCHWTASVEERRKRAAATTPA